MGTHPIFESDFDCLTDWIAFLKKMDKSNWATQYMEKQGWKEGAGIGKTLQGRSDIVKVKYKFDIHGVGHDQAKAHKFKWWERAFETAAAAIEVGDDNKIQRTGKSGPVVSTSLPVSKALNRAMLYGRFVKKGTMQGGKFTQESDGSDSDSSDDEVANRIGQVVEVTDAELFKRCGGLTGHKAARHGHNMTAKLDRLKKTEEEGIKRLQAVRAQQAERKEREDAADNTWELPFFEGEQPKVTISRLFEEPVAEPAVVDDENNVVKEDKPKKKKKKSKAKEEEVLEEETEVVEEAKPKKKKKKSKKTESADEPVVEEVIEVAPVEEKPKKKKKKNKKVEEEEVETVVEEKPKKTKKTKLESPADVDEGEPVKKKKKKSKSVEVE